MQNIFSRVNRKTILVIGDLMVDSYTMGHVKRISPEAPVVVLNVTDESKKPGGAGNVMCNLVALGMEVIALGRVGNDRTGSDLLISLVQEKIGIDEVVTEADFQTPLKNRMIAGNQQIVRVDYEKPAPLSTALEEQILDRIPELLKKVAAVTISDYAKGFCTPKILTRLIEVANQLSIPVIADPKSNSFHRYKNATILKPNLHEAFRAAHLDDTATLDEAAKIILKDIAVQTLMVTRSKDGISLFSRDKPRKDFPAYVHQVNDVTGAGDTVSAVMTVALANNLSLEEGAFLANIAASIAVERVGCASIFPHEIIERIQEIEHRGILSKLFPN